MKGGDCSDLNNYRPISKIPTLAKILLSQVHSQLKQFLADNNILSENQSGFRSGHSTILASMLVKKYIIITLDRKQHCAALFADQSKAFDSVDHELLLGRISDVGMGDKAIE